MEKPKRSLRSIAMEKNQKKPAGEPAFDKNTGAPCAQDQVKGSYTSDTASATSQSSGSSGES